MVPLGNGTQLSTPPFISWLTTDNPHFVFHTMLHALCSQAPHPAPPTRIPHPATHSLVPTFTMPFFETFNFGNQLFLLLGCQGLVKLC